MGDSRCSSALTTIRARRPPRNVSTNILWWFRERESTDTTFQASPKRRETSGLSPLKYQSYPKLEKKNVVAYSDTMLPCLATSPVPNVFFNGPTTLETCGVNALMARRPSAVDVQKPSEIVLMLPLHRILVVCHHCLLAKAIHSCCTTKICVPQKITMFSHSLSGRKINHLHPISDSNILIYDLSKTIYLSQWPSLCANQSLCHHSWNSSMVHQ